MTRATRISFWIYRNTGFSLWSYPIQTLEVHLGWVQRERGYKKERNHQHYWPLKQELKTSCCIDPFSDANVEMIFETAKCLYKYMRQDVSRDYMTGRLSFWASYWKSLTRTNRKLLWPGRCHRHRRESRHNARICDLQCTRSRLSRPEAPLNQIPAGVNS